MDKGRDEYRTVETEHVLDGIRWRKDETSTGKLRQNMSPTEYGGERRRACVALMQKDEGVALVLSM